MKTIISDKIYLSGLSFNQAEKIKTELTYNNPKFYEAMKFGRSTRGIDKTIQLYEQVNDVLIVPRGYATARHNDELNKINALSEFGAITEDNRHSHRVVIKTIIEPRPYQERALRLMVNGGSGVLVAPTGSGKTTIGIELAARLGERCLILVRSIDLAKQWQGAIQKFTGLDCGLIGGGKWTEGEQFTVALTQTLVKHEAGLDYGLVIVDECHNIPAQQAYKVINNQAAKYRYGLSATPQRRDNLEFMITAAVGHIVAEIEQNEVSGAVLPVSVSTLHYNFQGKAFSWVEFINLIAADEGRNQMIIASAMKSSRMVGTAILTGTVAHAEILYAIATERGIDALLLHGQLPKKQRDNGMKSAHDSRLIIGTLSLLSEGIDWPHIGAIILPVQYRQPLTKETPAATRLIQSIGRARRPFPGKVKAFVMDIVDNCAFGKSAFRKRKTIYKQQCFDVRVMAGSKEQRHVH